MIPRFVRTILFGVIGLALLVTGSRTASARGKAPARTPAPTPATPATPAARPSKAAQTQAAYERARKLFRQSRYKEAIRAFEEVKDLQYHPILDYGIAKCHEGLQDFQSSIYYLEKYVRNYLKHTMSKRHPTIADAKVKIGVLKKRLKELKARPRPRPGPDRPGPEDPITPPPAPGDVQPRRRVGATTPHREAFPGPSPFSVPPPPVYAPVKPKPRVWTRRSIILFFGLGGGAFVREDHYTLGEKLSANGGLDMGLLWRINPYVAIGPTAYIGGGVTNDRFFVRDAPDPDAIAETDGARLLYASVLLETRAILPVSRVDFWLGFGIGYTHISLDYKVGDEETEVTIPSLGLRGTVGLDIFMSEKFTMGLTFSFIGTVPTKVCAQNADCTKPADHNKPGLLWHLGLTFNWHLPTSSLPKAK